MKQYGKKILAVVLSLSVTLTLAATVLAAAEGTGYADVPATAWYAEAVKDMTSRSLMNGTGNGRFTPDGTLTRAMLATIVYRVEGEPAVTGEDAFTDTDSGTWYSEAVIWANQAGYVQGYGNGRFGTTDPVSQEQLVTILWRYAGQTAPVVKNNADGASDWAADAVAWAREHGVVTDNAGYLFAPRSDASRAQIAVILHSYLNGKIEDNGTGEENGGQKVLIAYFAVAENSNVDAVSSASVVPGTEKGMSRFMADIIAERTGGDQFSIRTEEEFPGVYNDLADRAKEQQDKGELPVLTSHIENLDDYDVIFIGYPIWWYTLPQVMFSFFEEYDFSGKTIIPFCTHLGSRDGGTFTRITELEPNAVVKDGLAVSQTDVADSTQTVLDWLAELGY